MKVVLLAPTPPPAGGIAGWTVRMMNAHLKDGWTVAVVDEKTIGSRQTFGKAGKRNLFDEIKRCFQIWGNLRRELRDPEAQVVHSCIPSVTFAMMREYVCACITHSKRRKFIIHFRCTVPNTTKGKMGHFMLRRLCNKSDMVFSLNRQTTDYLYQITKTQIVQIPNFIASEELMESHEVRDELKTVLYVGGLVEDKGVGDCLKIAAHFPEIEFRLAGKGDAVFEQYAREHQLNNVVFLGQLDRASVKEELMKADVFLFMTYFRGEGFSNALCEAMAAGLPCVVTDWAANADMVGDDGGVVVPVKDVDKAVEAIRSMLDPKTRRVMSESNISKVQSKYLEPIVINQYVDGYNELLNR